jgi:hypothetical protein
LRDGIEVEIRIRRILTGPKRIGVGKMARRHREIVGRGEGPAALLELLSLGQIR